MTRTREWFLEFAEVHFGVSRDILEKAAVEAESQDRSWHYFAADRGLLDSVQASIVQTLLHPDEVLEDYEFIDLLGRGAMGVVYRARQKSLDRIVAIKTILPGTSRVHDRFRVEAQTIAKLQHPNIVTPFEFFDRDGRFFLVLELLEGGTLSERLHATGAMSEKLTWSLMLQTVSGLLYARQHNVVHRDVKPQNLFLLERPPGSSLPEGVPLLKIADFGLAASIERSSEDTSLTLEGNVVGTPIYMSPEQTSDSHVDHRADIYALGATAFHMLAGSPMYAGESLMRVLLRKQNSPPARLAEVVPDVSKASSDLIYDMMALDPKDRPQEYEQLIRRIEEILKDAPDTSIQIGASTSSEEDTLEFQSGFDTLEGSAEIGQAPRGRVARWIAIAVLVACVCVTTIAVASRYFRTKRPLPQTEMDFSGSATALFDGTSIEGWTARPGGFIDDKLDFEGVGVLEVSGTTDCEFPSYSNFLLTAGINLLDTEATTAQILDSDGAVLLEMVVSRSEVIVKANGDVAQVELQKDPWKNATAEEPMYRELRVDAEPFRWMVSFDGRQVAVVPKPSSTPKRLRLSTDDACHFEGIQVAERISLSAKP